MLLRGGSELEGSIRGSSVVSPCPISKSPGPSCVFAIIHTTKALQDINAYKCGLAIGGVMEYEEKAQFRLGDEIILEERRKAGLQSL